MWGFWNVAVVRLKARAPILINRRFSMLREVTNRKLLCLRISLFSVGHYLFSVHGFWVCKTEVLSRALKNVGHTEFSFLESLWRSESFEFHGEGLSCITSVFVVLMFTIRNTQLAFLFWLFQSCMAKLATYAQCSSWISILAHHFANRLT